MNKVIILSSVCAGLASLTMTGLFTSSSSASSITNPSSKQTAQLDAPVVEPAPTLEDQAPSGISESLPEPEIFQSPVETVQPQNGEVNIRLMNETNVSVRYSVLGDTGERVLAAQSGVYLSGLNVPVEMTFHREDNGFLTANPQATTAGVLEVRLDETASFGAGESGLIIQETGAVTID